MLMQYSTKYNASIELDALKRELSKTVLSQKNKNRTNMIAYWKSKLLKAAHNLISVKRLIERKKLKKREEEAYRQSSKFHLGKDFLQKKYDQAFFKTTDR